MSLFFFFPLFYHDASLRTLTARGRYFEHHHLYFPVVRTREPDAVYSRSSLLFWAIITVAARNEAREPELYEFLAFTLPPRIWAAISSPPSEMVPTITALLVLTAWPLPSNSMQLDPTPRFMAFAMNACFIIGLHLARGQHPEYHAKRHFAAAPDEEACYVWAGCNILSQR